MISILLSFAGTSLSSVRSRRELVLGNLVLRQQLAVLKRSVKRPKITAADRAFWSLLFRWWSRWREALVIVKTGDCCRAIVFPFQHRGDWLKGRRTERGEMRGRRPTVWCGSIRVRLGHGPKSVENRWVETTTAPGIDKWRDSCDRRPHERTSIKTEDSESVSCADA
jgi:hypothetical protein